MRVFAIDLIVYNALLSVLVWILNKPFLFEKYIFRVILFWHYVSNVRTRDLNGVKHIFMLKFKTSYLSIKSFTQFRTLVCGRSRSYTPNAFTVQTLFKVESTGNIFTSFANSIGISTLFLGPESYGYQRDCRLCRWNQYVRVKKKNNSSLR